MITSGALYGDDNYDNATVATGNRYIPQSAYDTTPGVCVCVTVFVCVLLYVCV